jgi:hypothetical protein
MGEVPGFVREETEARRVYPHFLELAFEDHMERLQYRWSRWSWMAYERKIRERRLFCWVTLKRRRVAALQLIEFEPVIQLTNDDFFFNMDEATQMESDLAAVLCNAWGRFSKQVMAHGNLVDFRMAWADPGRHPPSLWAAAAEAVIAHELPGYSLLTMKAFPLEYAGRAPAGSASQVGLRSRQRAMVKYYQRLFGVQKFPGTSGDQGWLYRVNPDVTMEKPKSGRWSKASYARRAYAPR